MRAVGAPLATLDVPDVAARDVYGYDLLLLRPDLHVVWRGNALQASAKGHEYMLDHYLGTHTNKIADEVAGDLVHDINFRKEAPKGKMDLVIDINFRMDTSALYSDVVLPAASWYESGVPGGLDVMSASATVNPFVTSWLPRRMRVIS